jgi:hypothetical protein
VSGGGDGGGDGGDGRYGGEEDGDEEDVGKGGDGDKEVGRDGVEVEEESTGLGSMVFAIQSIRGLTFSSQGIPRIMACAPIEETKKVSRRGIPARV